MTKITHLIKNLLSYKIENKIGIFLLIGGIKTGLILTLFTPLIVGPFGITFSTYPKAVFFRTLVEIIFILYLLLIFFKPEYRPRISLLVIVTSIFVGILILSGLMGISFYSSFFGELHRAEGIILHIHLLVFFLIFISVFRKKEDYSSQSENSSPVPSVSRTIPQGFNLFRIALIVSGISGLAGICQKLGIFSFYGLTSPDRISGTFTNPDFFAPYLVLAIFLGIFVLTIERRKIFKIVWILILVLNFSTLILSGTRGAWVGMGAGIVSLFSFWLFYSNVKQKLRKAVLFGVLFFLIFVLLIILNQSQLSLDQNYYFQRAMSIPDINQISSRFPAWNIAIEAWRERPILGWGPESFGFVYDKFFKASYLQQVPENIFFDRTHNKILGLMATTGILGTLSYLSIFFVLFYLIFKYNKFQRNKEQPGAFSSLILAALLIGYFVQNLFIFDTISTYIIFFLIIGFVNNNFKTKEKSKEKKLEEEQSQFLTNKNPKRFSQKLINIFLIFSYICFSLMAFYQLNFKPTKASLMIIQGGRLERKDLNLSLSYYKKGMTQNTIFDGDFKMEVTQRLLTIFEKELAKESRQGMLEILAGLKPFFEEELEKPDRVSNLYIILFGINEKLHMFARDPIAIEDMEKVLKEALEVYDQRPQFYQLMGVAKIFKGDWQAGEVFFQKAFELTPRRLKDEITILKNLGGAYRRAGNDPKGAEHLKRAFDIDYSLKKFTISLSGISSEELQEKRDRSWGDMLFAEELALMHYLKLNDFDTCREIYEKAIKIYPEHQEYLQSHLEILTKDKEKK